ncbi:MAG: hypothetical protein AB1374_12630 [Bacillota bacterium]
MISTPGGHFLEEFAGKLFRLYPGRPFLQPKHTLGNRLGPAEFSTTGASQVFYVEEMGADKIYQDGYFEFVLTCGTPVTKIFRMLPDEQKQAAENGYAENNNSGRRGNLYHAYYGKENRSQAEINVDDCFFSAVILSSPCLRVYLPASILC